MGRSKNIQQMLDYPPSKFVLSLYEFKTAHRQRCARDFSGYVKMIEEALETLGLAVALLNHLPKKNWPKHRGIQVSFLPGAIETLFCGFDDLLDGFYEEATILNRSVFDALFKMVYISLHPDKCAIALGQKPPKGESKYNLSNFIEHELNIDWKYLWHYSSALVHGKNHRVLKMWCDSSRGVPQLLSFDLKYDKYAVTRPLNEILVYSWCLLRLVMLVAPEVGGINNNDNADRVRSAEASLRESLLGMPNKLKAVIADFEKVEKMISISEGLV